MEFSIRVMQCLKEGEGVLGIFLNRSLSLHIMTIDMSTKRAPAHNWHSKFSNKFSGHQANYILGEMSLGF